MATGIFVNPLNLQEAAYFYTRYQVVVTADALTQTSAATAQTWNIIPLAIGDIVRYACYYLKIPLQDDDDAAFNSDTMSLGDGGSATRFWAAQELNANGTFVNEAQGPSALVAPYTSADNLVLTVNSMTAKVLNNINVGEFEIYAEILTPSKLSLARSAMSILTKS